VRLVKAVYFFIVGDMTILIGIVATFLVLALINWVSAFAFLHLASGFILVVAVLGILFTTLTLTKRANKKVT
jgi:hypothetical protein